MWFIKNIASRLAKALLGFFPVMIFSFLLPYPYKFTPQINLGTFLIFILSMFLALLVVVGFIMLIYISAFYTLNPMGIRIVLISLCDFLSGAIIPLPFLPEKLRQIVELTPFASMQNLPFLILGGHIQSIKMLQGVLLQCFWAVALIAFGCYWLNKALQKAVIQGG